MIYDLMKYHFDLTTYPGINLSKAPHSSDAAYQESRIDIVQDLLDSLGDFSVKLAAAFARIRIERQASGETLQDQMLNILPLHVREKEQLAIDIPKTFRIHRCSVAEIEVELNRTGISVYHDNNNSSTVRSLETIDSLVFIDKDFPDTLVVPSSLFSEVNSTGLVAEGKLVFQDKASMCIGQYLQTLDLAGTHVIDTRAGCGMSSLCNIFKVFFLKNVFKK